MASTGKRRVHALKLRPTLTPTAEVARSFYFELCQVRGETLPPSEVLAHLEARGVPTDLLESMYRMVMEFEAASREDLDPKPKG